MNKRLFINAFFLIPLCLIIGQSYACPTLRAIISDPDPKFFGKEMAAAFYGGSSIGSISLCTWSGPSEAGPYDVVFYTYNYTNDIVNCKFHNPGAYLITLIVTDEENPNRTDDANCVFYVMEALLNIDGVDDDDEENPGGYVSLNDDDDDGDGVVDYDDGYNKDGIPGTLDDTNPQENDLVEISLSVSPSLSTGTMRLAFDKGAYTGLRVWNSPTKGDVNMIIPNGDPPCYYKEWPVQSMPTTLYVEGISTSSPRFDELWLAYKKDAATKHTDTVNFTVVKVEIDKIYFKGIDTKNIALKHHTNGAINAPEWTKTNGDSHWANVGAWVKSITTPIKVDAQFTVSPSDLTSVSVWADKSGGPVRLYKPSSPGQPVDITAAGSWRGTFEADACPIAILYYKNGDWHWNWKVKKVNGVALISEGSAGKTSHDICITAANPVTNSESISTPVYKWVIMASCKAADGQGANPDTFTNIKTIVDDLFGDLAASARVDNWTTKLNYKFPDAGGGSSTDSLLDDTQGSCGDWRRYFFDMCAAQGVGANQGLKMASFYRYVWSDGTCRKWDRFRVEHIGINNPDPTDWRTTGSRSIVDAGEYPNPPASKVNYQTVTWWWGGGDAFWDHSVVVLTGGANDYLYDPSFPSGVKTVIFPAPAYPGQSTEALPMSHLFIQNYFNYAAPYLYGYINTGGGYQSTHIHTTDFANPGANPDKLYLTFRWRN
jgi:hypothetical protein